MGASAPLHPVVEERGERRLADAKLLQLDAPLEPFEQALPATQHDGRDDDRQLVDGIGRQGLADEVRTARQVDVLGARRLPGP